MVIHQETSGHKMALSMADLSVWCYLCDSYLDNQVSIESWFVCAHCDMCVYVSVCAFLYVCVLIF